MSVGDALHAINTAVVEQQMISTWSNTLAQSPMLASQAAQQMREHAKAARLSGMARWQASAASATAKDGMVQWHRAVNRRRHRVSQDVLAQMQHALGRVRVDAISPEGRSLVAALRGVPGRPALVAWLGDN